jgi:hypothetical protein
VRKPSVGLDESDCSPPTTHTEGMGSVPLTSPTSDVGSPSGNGGLRGSVATDPLWDCSRIGGLTECIRRLSEVNVPLEVGNLRVSTCQSGSQQYEGYFGSDSDQHPLVLGMYSHVVPRCAYAEGVAEVPGTAQAVAGLSRLTISTSSLGLTEKPSSRGLLQWYGCGVEIVRCILR